MVGPPHAPAGPAVTPGGSAGVPGLSATWPEALREALDQVAVASVSTLARGLAPVTHPMCAFWGADRSTIDVSAPLAFGAIPARARRDRHVALLLEAGGAPGAAPTDPVLVCGLAAVRDADLVANADRFAAESLRRTPGLWRGIPTPFLRRQRWLFARAWIEVTPTQVLWWPQRRLDQPPRRWYAPAGTALRHSDPAPTGEPAAARGAAPIDWRSAARHWLRGEAALVVTVLDHDKAPLPLPALGAEATPDGFAVRLPRGIPVEPRGPVCVTFHRHSPELHQWESRSFIGSVTALGADDTTRVAVDRALPSLDLTGTSLRRLLTLARRGRAARRRTAVECARRGQRVPRVRLPARR